MVVKKAKSKITLKHVAEYTGLSIQTVSNVIHEKDSMFTPETRKKVLKAVRELGYRPNFSAQAMRRGNFRNIALITSNVAHQGPFFQETLVGLQEVLWDNGYHLTLTRLPDEILADENYVVSILREYMADALLINYIKNIPQRFLNIINDFKLPSIWINTRREYDAVYFDEYSAAVKATNHFLEHGHKKIALLNLVDNQHHSITDRTEGYENTMRNAGLDPRIIGGKYTPYEDCIEIFKDLFSERDCPTALISMTDSTLNMLNWLAINKILTFPEKLSFISFSGKKSQGVHVPYTYMIPSMFEMGTTAAQMVLRKVSEPQVSQKSSSLQLTLEHGQSVFSI